MWVLIALIFGVTNNEKACLCRTDDAYRATVERAWCTLRALDLESQASARKRTLLSRSRALFSCTQNAAITWLLSRIVFLKSVSILKPRQHTQFYISVPLFFSSSFSSIEFWQ